MSGAEFIVRGRCTLCNATCDNWKTRETHLAGSKHQAALKRHQSGATGEAPAAAGPTAPCAKCKRSLTAKTSNTAKNPGRQFFCCDSLGHKFFAWADENGAKKETGAVAMRFTVSVKSEAASGSCVVQMTPATRDGVATGKFIAVFTSVPLQTGTPVPVQRHSSRTTRSSSVR